MRQFITLPMVLVLIGSLIATVGVFLLTVRQAQERAAVAETRAKAETELREKSEEIQKLNKRLADLVTGGEGYALAVVSPLNKIGGPVIGYNLYIEYSAGDAPLYDLRINIYEIHISTGMVFFEEVYRDEVPILTPQTGPLRLGDGSVYGFGSAENLGVMIRQRNGIVLQNIKLLKKDDTYLLAEKAIFTTNDGKEQVVLESMPPEFLAAGRGAWYFGNFDMAKTQQPR